MINQDSQEYKNWIALLETNPPKTKGYLMDVNGGCCLGYACLANYLKQSRDGNNIIFGMLESEKESQVVLPKGLAKQLNITTAGDFTNAGERYTKIFLREYLISYTEKNKNVLYGLTGINDHTNAGHNTIGQLIQHLAMIEHERGVECFSKFN